VTGIGFLGAGTIMRIGADVQGLTTASSIWLVAGVGMAVGTGMYIVSVIEAILALFISTSSHVSGPALATHLTMNKI
jgi:putative Mg2+ transporter-C (MgtC) family protein